MLSAKEAYPHIKMGVKGEVKHIQDKPLEKTKMKNIMVVSSEMKGGKEVSDVYNIELYGDKNMAKAEGIKVGDIVSTKGHVRHYDFVKDGQTITNKSFQNPYEIENHTREQKAEMKVETAADKSMDKSPDIKPKTAKKGKGLGI